jgi:hypothetical protein
LKQINAVITNKDRFIDLDVTAENFIEICSDMMDEIIENKAKIVHISLFSFEVTYMVFKYFHTKGYGRGDFIPTYPDIYEELIDLQKTDKELFDIVVPFYESGYTAFQVNYRGEIGEHLY